MKNILLFFTGLVLVTCQQDKQDISTKVHSEPKTAPYGIETNEITFNASDSIKIFADAYTYNKRSPTIILFHQASANARSEYQSILPKLASANFNVLAVDQRSGGQLFGKYNRTVELLDKAPSYCDTYPDFEASVKYLRDNDFTGKIIVWGSSYSGSLAIKLAATNPEVAGAIAFSPASGGPMEDCKPDEYIISIEKPLLIMRPLKEAAIPSVKSQLLLATDNGHQTYIAENGTHGSSMLVESRVKADVNANWERVYLFLNTFDN